MESEEDEDDEDDDEDEKDDSEYDRVIRDNPLNKPYS